MTAFAAAGWRMDDTSKAFDELELSYKRAMNDASQQNIDEYERAEDLLLSHTDYQACKEYGKRQAEYLKALDFMDILTDKIRFYKVCRAKTNVNAAGEHCNC
eukprot:3912471-Prorocentrum_lima.AAC.1